MLQISFFLILTEYVTITITIAEIQEKKKTDTLKYEWKVHVKHFVTHSHIHIQTLLKFLRHPKYICSW